MKHGMDDELRTPVADPKIPTPLHDFADAAAITGQGRTAGQAVWMGPASASSKGSTPRKPSRTRPSQQAPESPFQALACQTFSGPIPTPLSGPPGTAPATAPDDGGAGVSRIPPDPVQTPGDFRERVGGAVGAETAETTFPGTGELPAEGAPATALAQELPEEARRTDACGRLPDLTENLEIAGPFLQFLGIDLAESSWRGSVLVVLPPDAPLPVLLLNDGALLALPSPLFPVSLSVCTEQPFCPNCRLIGPCL